MLLVVLLYLANNFPPSITINLEICWLIGADILYSTVECGILNKKKDDRMIVMIKSYCIKSGKWSDMSTT